MKDAVEKTKGQAVYWDKNISKMYYVYQTKDLYQNYIKYPYNSITSKPMNGLKIWTSMSPKNM